jgi:hypothetical protein
MRLVHAAAGLAVLSLPAIAAEPPKPAFSTDAAKCTWEWRTGGLAGGGTVGIWGETCKFDTGTFEPVFNPELPGFTLTVNGAPQETVVQLFTKSDEADISAVLPDLRRQGFIPDDEDCIFMPATQETLATIAPPPETTRGYYEIMPTGDRLAALDATPDDEVPEPPCGEYGWSTHGVRFFMTDIEAPGTVAYFNLGQDGTMIAPTSLVLE